MRDKKSSLKKLTRPSAPSRPWLSAFLAVAVIILAAVLIRMLFQAGTDLPTAPKSISRSTNLHFEKKNLRNPQSAVRTSHVQVIDFDRDGTNDLMVCDTARSAVIWHRQKSNGVFEEKILAESLKCPAHATVVDLDRDGDLDVLVAVLGSIFPWDELVGQVVLLENRDGKFVPQTLLDDVRRVADVQAGDLDADGDLDLAVAVFGYARGEVLWLENRGKSGNQWRFRDHQLLDRPGVIHVPLADLDQDGDLDVSAIVSQEEEELWSFENLGQGKFKARQLYASPNYDIGSAGLLAADLDQDGRTDFILPQGDNLEDPYAWPQPYHGCLWFRNLGGWKFESRRIASFGGAYAAGVGDLDGDKDLDLVLVSLCNDWSEAARPSAVWLENDGRQNFKQWAVDTEPIGLITVACGDLNQDGRADLVAGSLMLPPLLERRVQQLTIWESRKGGR